MATTSRTIAHKGERQTLKQRIDQISLRVQSRFHVQEMCLIDPEGAEISRIVGDEVAHDLALDEADAIFFRAGFRATSAASAHLADLYVAGCQTDGWWPTSRL